MPNITHAGFGNATGEGQGDKWCMGPNGTEIEGEGYGDGEASGSGSAFFSGGIGSGRALTWVGKSPGARREIVWEMPGVTIGHRRPFLEGDCENQ